MACGEDLELRTIRSAYGGHEGDKASGLEVSAEGLIDELEGSLQLRNHDTPCVRMNEHFAGIKIVSPSQGRGVPKLDSHRSDPAVGPEQTRASSDKSGEFAGSMGITSSGRGTFSR